MRWNPRGSCLPVHRMLLSAHLVAVAQLAPRAPFLFIQTAPLHRGWHGLTCSRGHALRVLRHRHFRPVHEEGGQR